MPHMKTPQIPPLSAWTKFFLQPCLDNEVYALLIRIHLIAHVLNFGHLLYVKSHQNKERIAHDGDWCAN